MIFYWILNVLLFTTRFADASIAGVTYQDDFDFEERYHKNECDPMLFYPLHAPERCQDVYEKLIRQKLGHYGPLPIEPDPYAPSYPWSPIIHYQSEPVALANHVKDIPLSPYEVLFKHLTADIQKDPKKPEVVITDMGPFALYKQTVSKQTEKMIMDLAKERAGTTLPLFVRIRKDKKHRRHRNHHH